MPAPVAARRLSALLALLLGCSDAADPCANIRGEVPRENCQFERIATLFEIGDARWHEQLQALPSAASRDLVRLRLAIVEPQQGPAICAEVETKPARARCQQVVGRPHLASPPQLPPQRQP